MTSPPALSLAGEGPRAPIFRRKRLRANFGRFRCGWEVTIVDFYCAALRLALEIAGSAHDELRRALDDLERERALDRWAS